MKHEDYNFSEEIIAKIEYARINNMTSLDLGGMNMKIIPPEVFELTSLKNLYLGANEITELPSNISKLQNLRVLIVSDNHLKYISPSINNLNNLEHLSLSNNYIKTLPSEIGDLKNLKYLKIEDNDIFELPTSFSGLNNLQKITLDGDRMHFPPPEIASHGDVKTILSYLQEIEEQGSLPINEAKLLIVGNGAVGKTSLIKRIITGEFNAEENTTEGIDVQKWIIENNFRINIWDFGGQEIYHTTHQFFLTKRSLYLLIWEARREDDIIDFSYWLNIIKLLSNNSPVIIVQNKSDERIKNLDEASLCERYDNIIRFFHVSAKTGDGIDELKKFIKKTITKLNHVETKMPEKWFQIRHELEKSKHNYISYDSYFSICHRYKIRKDVAFRFCSYFHDLGVFLCFQDHPLLKEIVVLKPTWATSEVYKLLDDKDTVKNYGNIKQDTIERVWKDVKQNIRIYLIELMVRFELCFIVPQESTYNGSYIIPELLPETRPPHVPNLDIPSSDNNKILYIYQYDFMPSGIMARLIVRNNEKIDNKSYWKNGMIIQYRGNKAIVIADRFQHKIYLQISGPSSLSLFGIIDSDIQSINRTLHYPDYKLLIPCRCKRCKKARRPHLFEFRTLENAKQKGVRIQCQISFEMLDVDELLSTYSTTYKKRSRGKMKRNEKININISGNAQLNTGFDNSTFNISQNNNIDLNTLAKLIDNIRNAVTAETSSTDIETISENLEVIENEICNSKPRKSFLKIAMIGLQSIKGSAEFCEAVTTLIQFIQTLPLF